jgi:CRP/FNR family transcriptional regulator
MALALATRQEFAQPRASANSAGQRRATAIRPDYLRSLDAPAPADLVDIELHRIGTSVTFARGRLVIEEANPADHIFRVESGALRVVRQLPDGRRCITNFLMAGDYFGLAENAAYKASVEAITDARIVRYQRSAFDRLCERSPHAGRRFLDLLGRQLSAAQDRLVLLGQNSALERLAAFLLSMAERTASGTSPVALPMDRSDIADYLGLRIETVSRILTALRRRKIIGLPNFHSFAINDRDALEMMAEGEE